MQNKASTVPAGSCLGMIWPSHLNSFASDLLSKPGFSILTDNAKVCTCPVWDAMVAKYLCPDVIDPQPRHAPFLLEPPSALKTLKAVLKPGT